MPKTQNKWSERIYYKRLKEGRGKGEYADYRPWVTVQEIPSKGISARILGEKTNRLHHLFSRNEIAFFYILEANDDVLDIREQFPLLDVLDTVRIAERAGIRHPRDSKSKYPYVSTSDFFIVTRSGYRIRSIKDSSDLKDVRTLEKQEIERRYWAEYGYDWKIITENEINFQKADNLSWIRKKAKYLHETVPEQDILMEALYCFCDEYNNSIFPINIIASDIEEVFGFEPGTGISVFAKAAADKLIEVDLGSPLDTTAVRCRKGRGMAC